MLRRCCRHHTVSEVLKRSKGTILERSLQTICLYPSRLLDSRAGAISISNLWSVLSYFFLLSFDQVTVDAFLGFV